MDRSSSTRSVDGNVLKPIEELIQQGLVQRLQQVFDCPSIITVSTDRKKNLQRLYGGKDISYPFLFATPTSYSYDSTRYHSNRLARKGLEFMINPSMNQSKTVRLVPVKMEFDIEYSTDRAFGANSITWFAKRWLFAYRSGYLKFNIDYGRLAIRIDTALTESTSITPRDNVLDQESMYVATNGLTVNGWMSEEHVGEEGIVSRVDIETEVRSSNSTLWKFP